MVDNGFQYKDLLYLENHRLSPVSPSTELGLKNGLVLCLAIARNIAPSLGLRYPSQKVNFTCLADHVMDIYS